MNTIVTPPEVRVQHVWDNNFEKEFDNIQNAIRMGYVFAAIDTEFPGTIYELQPKPVYSLLPPQDYYSMLKKNVDVLEIIQLGLTLFDDSGNHYVWQFNFRNFDKKIHPYNEESIAFLEKQGINFSDNQEHGINSLDFAVKLRSLVLPYQLRWFTFQGSYDFAFLIKIMTRRELPVDVGNFMGLVGAYFGVNLVDLKLVTKLSDIHGGLQKIGETLGLKRLTGNCHQAGSDSLFTMQVFLELLRRNNCPSKFIWLNLKLYGLSDIQYLSRGVNINKSLLLKL